MRRPDEGGSGVRGSNEEIAMLLTEGKGSFFKKRKALKKRRGLKGGTWSGKKIGDG